MKKSILFSLAFSLIAAPLSVNAAVTEVDKTANSATQSWQTIIAGGLFEGIKDKVEGTVDFVDGTQENANSINDDAGNLKKTFNGGENSESDEVVEEIQIEEGTHSTEYDSTEYESSEGSGDSF